MIQELIVKATECKSCTANGKNPKSIILVSQFRPHTPCVEPNQEIQIDFLGPNLNYKGNEVYFLAAIDCFSKCSTACIHDKANGPNVIKFWTCTSNITEFHDLFD